MHTERFVGDFGSPTNLQNNSLPQDQGAESRSFFRSHSAEASILTTFTIDKLAHGPLTMVKKERGQAFPTLRLSIGLVTLIHSPLLFLATTLFSSFQPFQRHITLADDSPIQGTRHPQHHLHNPRIVYLVLVADNVRKRDDDREQQLVVFEEVIPPPVDAGLPPAEGDKDWPQRT